MLIQQIMLYFARKSCQNVKMIARNQYFYLEILFQGNIYASMNHGQGLAGTVIHSVLENVKNRLRQDQTCTSRI